MKHLAFACIFIFGGAIVSIAQTPTAPQTDEQKASSAVMGKVMEVELLAQLCNMSPNHYQCKGRNPIAELTGLYLDAVKDKQISKAIISRATEKGLANQLLVVIAQNQRIIELLEEMVRKK